MENRKLKIAHIADLHLDSSFRSFPEVHAEQLREEQRSYLLRLKRICMDEKVQVLLCAGDVFDNPDPHPIWFNRFLSLCRELSELYIYIVPGNHDPYYPNSIWDSGDWPENVFIFKQAGRVYNSNLLLEVCGSPFTGLREKSDLTADLKGIKMVDTDKVPEAASPETLNMVSRAGEPAISEAGFRILMLHGELTASPNSQSNYNPIHEKDPWFDDFDTVALGHIHMSRELRRTNDRNTAIRYAGCPQGRGFDELGDKGFWIETLERKQDFSGKWYTDHNSRFVSLQSRRFLIEAIDVSGIEDVRSLELAVQDYLKYLEKQYGSESFRKSFLRLRLTGRLPLDTAEIDLASLRDLVLAYGLDYAELRNQTRPAWPIDQMRDENGFFGVLVREFDAEMRRISKSRKTEEEKEAESLMLEEALNYALEAGDAQK